MTSFQIGTSTAALANLSEHLDRDPRTDYKIASRVITLADGSQRGLGYPSVEWHFTSLPQDQRDWLRAYCTGASASVYITTRTVDSSDSFKTFSAQMHWPVDSEEYYDAAGKHLVRQDFNVRFLKLVEVTTE